MDIGSVYQLNAPPGSLVIVNCDMRDGGRKQMLAIQKCLLDHFRPKGVRVMLTTAVRSVHVVTSPTANEQTVAVESSAAEIAALAEPEAEAESAAA